MTWQQIQAKLASIERRELLKVLERNRSLRAASRELRCSLSMVQRAIVRLKIERNQDNTSVDGGCDMI